MARQLGDQLPGGHWYVGDIPEWWLWGFYGGIVAVLFVEWVRRRWRWILPAGLVVWLCIGLLARPARPADEMRCTFLSVGHGNPTVLEMPDGRTVLFDVGSMAGPEVTARQIAPFLWSRGIRRIDEVFLSHADIDHFNGLVELVNRFAVARVTCTPTFADKETPGVAYTLDVLRQKGIPVRIVKAGDRLSTGAVTIDVIHPPAEGPPGEENARSMVLLIRHAGHTFLLTGDLDKSGLEIAGKHPLPPIDILMAPHHGSRSANTPAMAEWTRPRIVVSCQGPPRSPVPRLDPYRERDPGTEYLTTWSQGAITIRSRAGQLDLETLVTGRRLKVAEASWTPDPQQP